MEWFWRHVQKTEGCWLWIGHVDKGGYGILTHNHIAYRAHRLSYELAYGPLPDGFLACHNCPNRDNPSCVRPEHLYAGTHADNMHDTVVKQSHPQGEKRFGAKLTEQQVRDIRARYVPYHVSMARLAKEYGVAEGTIQDIISRRRWKYVE